jgi:hypothetical protein
MSDLILSKLMVSMGFVIIGHTEARDPDTHILLLGELDNVADIFGSIWHTSQCWSVFDSAAMIDKFQVLVSLGWLAICIESRLPNHSQEHKERAWGPLAGGRPLQIEHVSEKGCLLVQPLKD